LTVREYTAEKQLLLDAYRELLKILVSPGIEPVVVGVAMRGQTRTRSCVEDSVR